MLSEQAQAVSQKECSTLLERSVSLEEFEKDFKQKISDTLLKNYGQEMLIKTRVERDVERNIVTQSMEDSFIPPTILVELNRDERIDKTTEKTVWNIMEIRDTSTENMRSDELRTLRDLIHRLDFFIGKEHHPGLEKKRQRLLEEMDEERASVTYTQDR